MYKIGKIEKIENSNEFVGLLMKTLAGIEIEEKYVILKQDFETLEEVAEFISKSKQPRGWKIFKILNCEVGVNVKITDELEED